MYRFLTTAASVAALTLGLSAQATLTPATFGDGSDGAFAPTANATLDTDKQACYQFTSVNIPTGVTITVVGSKPLYIKSTGGIAVAGSIVGDGAAGVSSGNNSPGGAGGAGGPGGGAGGDGGAMSTTPFNGTGADGKGLRPGIGGTDSAGAFTDPVGGGGGGGNATAGAKGGAPNNTTTTLNTSGPGGKAGICRAGAGGGGGAADIDSTTTASSNDGGGGGGGGGGWITLCAPKMDVSGSISVNGGAGGTSTGNGGGAGGGAGGCIDLVCPAISFSGTMSAIGGAAGGATQNGCGCSPGGLGGDGCINVYGSISGTGTAKPAAQKQTGSLVINESCSLDVAIKCATSTDNYLSGVGVIKLNPPLKLFGGLVCTLDDAFLTTLFLNNVGNLLQNSNGTGSGTITVGHPLALLPGLHIDVVVILQALTTDKNGITGVSNCVEALIKL